MAPLGMLKNVVRAPMSFFDTTPGGRIVNRFSRDVEITDNMLPGTMRQVLNCAGRVLTTIITISYGTPIFLSVMVPLAILYVLIQVVYIPTSRQLRRIDSITRSPIYVHFSETLSGASSIRAYRAQDRFIRQSKEKVDHNFKFYFAGIAASTWLGFRLQLLGNIVVFAAAIFAVASTDIETGLVGLSVSYASQMTGALEFLVNMMSEVETNIVSVERIKEYTYTPREATWIIEEKRPDPSWPQLGNVEFQGYETRYRPGLDLVLKGLSCTIKGGEKIGIVGRTGAGKSSMTVALFRIIEAAGGKIVIDGLNISDMGLHDLRSKLTILPQVAHAVCLSVCLVGQRQLVCLARTLLRKTKILVLDEATAAVDFETDELIQKTIRTQFQDNTILTIAHRLNTILDYDRVMVLDQGLIKEFDAPNALLSDKNGVFYGMAKDAGLV
ncbi:multidrug resistance-associated protein 1 [Aplysia californica]|uniref:Multidrug resistance-associated protein 1 n=1 Tax=Aplysia californica TaxID=6500 RepID=A0ABM1AEQ5_APLCA|nr:multidrug resistance-associated protein 1 [Aplysia californica]